jgi:hypothetical protein
MKTLIKDYEFVSRLAIEHLTAGNIKAGQFWMNQANDILKRLQ